MKAPILRPLRILYIVFDGTLGGSLASFADLVRHTDSTAAIMTFCILGRTGATSDLIASLGAEVVSFGATSWHDVRAAVRFWRFLRGRSFDVVHNNARTYFGHVALLLAARGSARIYHEHGDLHTAGSEFACRVFYRVFRRIYDLFLTVGDETLDAMVAEGVPRRLIRNLSSPVDLGSFTPGLDRATAKAQVGVPVDRVIIGTACRLVHQKDLGLFLETASRMSERRPELRFLIAGEGDEEEELKARAVALRLEKQLLFIGNRTDMPVLWRAFDLFLLTSRQESFGRTILESLASGTPIVGVRPDMGGGRILDGAQGVCIIAGRNPQALCDAALALCDDPQRRERLGATGRHWLEGQAHFKVEHWAERMHEVYQSFSTSRLDPRHD